MTSSPSPPLSPEFGSSNSDEHPLPELTMKHIARLVLAMFVVTFVASRVLVALIMARIVPDLYLHLGKDTGTNGNHIHHLNYGIFLLSIVGAYLLFRRPSGRHLEWAAVVYAVGLALTFDEFGMWLHLGGGYWQRASFDAVVLIAAVLGLIAYAPSLKNFGPQHWGLTLIVAGAMAIFFVTVVLPLNHYARKWVPVLQQLEAKGPQ